MILQNHMLNSVKMFSSASKITFLLSKICVHCGMVMSRKDVLCVGACLILPVLYSKGSIISVYV